MVRVGGSLWQAVCEQTQQRKFMTFSRTALFPMILVCASAQLPAAAVQTTAVLAIEERVTGSVPLQPTERLPGAQGSVHVRTQGNVVELEVRMEHLKPASLFGGDYNTYVVWAISPVGDVENMGEMSLNGHKSILRGSTTLRGFGIVITAEPHYLVTRPSSFVVLDSKPIQEDGAFQYAVLDDIYYFERRSLTKVKEAKGPVHTEVQQAFTAFQLAQRAGAAQVAEYELSEVERSLDQLTALLRQGVSPNEIAVLARDTVRLAVAAQRLAEGRAFNAFESDGKAREEETAWARSARTD
jgi:hypothetical protein